MGKPNPRTKQNVDPVRIVLIDDHPLLRERLREMIENHPPYLVCGEAEDRAGGLRVVAAETPDLAIVDLSLKHSSGLELIKDLRVRHRDLKILVLSMHEETVYAERAIRAGANGYITKQEAGAKVVEAVKSVLGGECYLPAEIARTVLEKSIGGLRQDGRTGIDLLSDRELDVFRLIARGLAIRNIAAELSLDIKTIETYRSRIKQKLGYETSAELLQGAIRWTFEGTER